MAATLPTPTDPDVGNVLDRQVLVMFELAKEVLSGLTLDECIWRISDRSWRVHHHNGRWVGELGEEPPDLPPPSLAWTMWHPIWWLSVLLGHAHGTRVPSVDSVEWPGPEPALETIRRSWSEWMSFTSELDDASLQSGALSKFPYTDVRPFVHTIGWASVELTKNLSETCLLRRVSHELSTR